MTSLLREDTAVPMPEAASATTTSWPAIAAARATANPTTPAPTTSTCIRSTRSHLHRKARVILGQRVHGRFRARHIVELGELALAIKRIVARIEMKQLRHPPREALRLPDPPQARRRVALEQVAAALAIKLSYRAGEHAHVRQREIHALRAGRRLDVGGIAGEKKPPILHRLDHEAAHRGDALLQHGALREFARAADARVQLLPDARVRPVLDVIVGGALHIKPRQSGGTHGVKRETALVVGIDQLMLRRRRFGENPDPAERIFAVIGAKRGRRNARPANPMKAVAAADEVTSELDIPSLVPEADFWRTAGEIVDAHVARLEQYCPALREPPLDQILYHFLLAVDGHTLADEIAEIDVVQGAAEGEIDAVVEHAFVLHAIADARFDEQVARPLLDQSGTDATLDIVAATVLQDHTVHARTVEQMRAQQPGRPGTDNTDLRAHLTLRHRPVVPRARDGRSCPLPVGERATLFFNIKKWVRGSGCIRSAGNPLTPTLSPNGEREYTERAARSCTAGLCTNRAPPRGRR